MPVIVPFICQRYDIKVHSIVQSETQDGKGVADIHFATAMRHVIRYIEERRADIITPEDLVTALKHGQGMKGCIAELFNVNRNCKQYDFWWNAFKVGVEIGHLGRQNVIEYDHENSRKNRFIAKCFKSWYSEPVLWCFQKGSSTCLEQPKPTVKKEGKSE